MTYKFEPADAELVDELETQTSIHLPYGGFTFDRETVGRLVALIREQGSMIESAQFDVRSICDDETPREIAHQLRRTLGMPKQEDDYDDETREEAEQAKMKRNWAICRALKKLTPLERELLGLVEDSVEVVEDSE